MEDEGPRRALAWRMLGWVLAVGLIVGWIALLHAPGTIPWVLIAVATVAAIVLVVSAWSARPRGGANSLKH